MTGAAAACAAGRLDEMAGDNAAVLSGCRHYGVCGGCVDISDKGDLLPAALRAAGFADAVVEPVVVCPPYSRRRMDLAVRRVAGGVSGSGGVIVGLHRQRSHAVVDLVECRVLEPALVALFDPLRAVLGRLDLLRREGSVVANRVDNGIDLLLRTDGVASRHDRTRLAAFAAAHGVVRVCHAVGLGLPETLALLEPPRVSFSGVVVGLPSGGFLQATVAGEAAIVAAVVAGLPVLTRRERVAELFAGSGTLTFALAGRGRVDAFEADAGAEAALAAAARAAGLAGRVSSARRDLVRQPLMARELDGYCCVVLDPPAGGAAVQVAQIAASAVGRVVVVSCDSQTLARDLAVLRVAGFAVVRATPVDQFIGSRQIESVVVLARKRVRVRRG